MAAITIVTPTEASRHPILAKALRSFNIFGSPEWLSVLQDTYGFHPGYAVGENTKNETPFILPYMEVRSLLTGNRGISLPFSDYSDIFAANETALWEGIMLFKEYGRKKGWRYMELRPNLPENELNIRPAYSRYVTHSLDLRPPSQELFKSFSTNTKRNIRKAKKNDLSITISTSHDDLQKFYQLHTLARKYHGLPPQPLTFFYRLHSRIISQNNGIILIVFYKGIPVAGNIYLQRGERAWYKYGAMDRSHADSRAPFLAMWEGIRTLKTMGAKSLCLGRSDISAKGLIHFKDGWGTVRKTISYIRYDYGAQSFCEHGQSTGYHAANLFRLLPPSLLQIAGKFLYRHVA